MIYDLVISLSLLMFIYYGISTTFGDLMNALIFLIIGVLIYSKRASKKTVEEATTAPEAPIETPTEESKTSVQDFESTDLTGTWVGPCYASSSGDGSFNQLTFHMTETDWDLDYVAYGDENCTAKFLTVNIKGPYSLGESSSVAEGAREGTFSFATKTVTGHMDAALDVIDGACGVSDSEFDVPLDLAEGCVGLGAYPISECPADNDIVMVQGNNLHFGVRPSDNNMCSPDKRPTSFEGGGVVTKQ